MTSGIYLYYDDFKHRVVYVGKDSHIDENRRHKQHHQPCRKNQQKINTVLQNDLERNNINRYTYVVLERSDDWTNENLNEKEKYWISLFEPKFNFTEGGDGVGLGKKNPFYGKKHSEEAKKKMSEAKSGENHPLYGKKHSEETRRKISEALSGKNHPLYGIIGENNPNWKDYARVIKKGFKPNRKQNYALVQNGKTISTSIYKEKLEKLAEERNAKKNKRCLDEKQR